MRGMSMITPCNMAVPPLSARGSASGACRAGREQRVDLVRPEAGFLQDLRAVLAEPGRQATDGARRLAVGSRDAGHAQRPLARVLDHLPEPGGLEVRIAQQRLERVDAHRGNVALVELGEPLGVRAGWRNPRDFLVEVLDVLEARAQGGVARVIEQVLPGRERE